MYAALWRVLPGPIWLRVVILVALFALLLVVLASWIFPWINSFMPDTSGTVTTR